MKKYFMVALAAIFMLASVPAFAVDRLGPSEGVGGCKIVRDKHGHIKRSASTVRLFERLTGYPHGRPGYVVDHIVALKRGGCDVTQNLQWQTVNDAKAKDRWE